MKEKIEQLINTLKQKTDKGEAEWLKTSSRNEFQLSFENGKITTDSFTAEPEFGPNFDVVEVRIYNNKGDEVYLHSFTLQENESEYKKLMDFYKCVKASYYKVSETIDSMLNEANSNKVIGKEEDLPF